LGGSEESGGQISFKNGSKDMYSSNPLQGAALLLNVNLDLHI